MTWPSASAPNIHTTCERECLLSKSQLTTNTLAQEKQSAQSDDCFNYSRHEETLGDLLEIEESQIMLEFVG